MFFQEDLQQLQVSAREPRHPGRVHHPTHDRQAVRQRPHRTVRPVLHPRRRSRAQGQGPQCGRQLQEDSLGRRLGWRRRQNHLRMDSFKHSQKHCELCILTLFIMAPSFMSV